MLKSLYFFDFVDFLTGTSKPFLKDLSIDIDNHQNVDLLLSSMRTVESQRYRLSKKLKITKAKDLNSFILSV